MENEISRYKEQRSLEEVKIVKDKFRKLRKEGSYDLIFK